MFEYPEIVLASGNPGKIREFQAMLPNSHIVPQSQYSVPEVEETGTTFVENAIIKARQAARHTGLPALADDSGLVVDGLNGAPGVISARYAGKNASDQDNLDKLLTDIQSVPSHQRSARFVCIIVLMRHAEDPLPIIAQGTWEGQITDQIQGENGFGYDPVFWLPEHQCTSAQLSPEKKNILSHRGQALKELLRQITAT
jgi:XTP/dITP diphosphohydrolase